MKFFPINRLTNPKPGAPARAQPASAPFQKKSKKKDLTKIQTFV
jgi:hypothetical protein